jgi:hypothetical protein
VGDCLRPPGGYQADWYPYRDHTLMLIHCPYCIARVDADATGVVITRESDTERNRVSLLACHACRKPIVARDEFREVGQFDESIPWSDPVRVWPQPDTDISAYIPAPIRTSLVEASLCLRAGAYTGVVMTGRALEAMCQHFKTKSKTLGLGLKELLDQEIIDKRLFQWSAELRVHRNLAAHASGEDLSHDDAEDLFNFATAICDYVFVLNEKFARFMERKEAKKKILTTEADTCSME